MAMKRKGAYPVVDGHEEDESCLRKNVDDHEEDPAQQELGSSCPVTAMRRKISSCQLQ